ncbi:MAG TPA: hypothetical protein GXZ90_01080 [Clostridiales bacterium]|nr:hypothetical protein [Clostridiales bacterium]
MKILKNEKGYALIFAILMLALFSILSVGIMTTVSANSRIGRNERGLQSAYYISEAGIKTANNEFMDELVTIHESSNSADEFFAAISNYISTTYSGGNFKTINTFEDAYLSTPVAEVIIKEGIRAGDITEYEITSRGILDGGTRITSMKFSLKWAIMANPEFTVFTTDGMNINNGTINGPVGTIATASDAIKIGGWPTLNDVYVPDVSTGITKPEHYANMGEVKQIGEISYETPTYPTLPSPLPNFYPNTTIVDPDNPHNVVENGKVNITHYMAEGYTLQLNNDEYHLSELNINSNWTLNIDLMGGDRTLYIDKFSANSGKINIIGDGNLTIHINESMHTDGSFEFNKPNTSGLNANEKDLAEKKAVEKLAIYYAGAPTLTLDGANKTYASLFVKQADVNLIAGGGLFGHLISLGENIVISGGTNLMKGIMFVPNAHVQLSEGPVVTSPIIAKNLTMSGGTNLSFDPDYEMPINPFGSVFKTDINKLLSSQTPIREK